MTDLPLVLVWGLKAAPLLLGAWLATTLLRRASAATRHFVWVTAIAAALVLPVVTTVMPRWEVALPDEANAGERGRTRAMTGDDGRQAITGEQGRAGADPVVSSPSIVLHRPASPSIALHRLRSPGFALSIWALGAAGITFLIALSLYRTQRLARRGEPMSHAGVLAQVAEVSRRLQLPRPVTILHATDDAMPMTWGAFRPHVLVPASFPEWTGARRRAVLVHELAHVKRMDWVTQLMARLCCAIYWWNPLAWIAARRLREERELACDDLVLSHGTVPSSYAGDLLEIARSFRTGPATALAGVAMARRSQLADRLLAVLDASRVRGTVGSRQAAGSVAVTAALLLPLAALAAGRVTPTAPPTGDEPAPVVISAAEPASAPSALSAPSAPAPQQRSFATLCDWSVRGGRRSSSSTNIDDDRMTVKIVRDECTLSVDADGKITFTDDDRDVAGITSGGYFEIEEREGRDRRRVEIAAEGQGLERRWLVNGDEQPFGDEARAWLADALVVLMRRAGFNAEARALRIFREHGAQGLMAEIDQLQSDYVSSLYYQVLFANAELTPAQQSQLLDGAAQRISSDYELGRVLKTLAGRGRMEATVQRSYVRAAESLDSDYEHRQALEVLVRSGELDLAAMDAMLASAQQLDSDYERAELLTATAARYPAGRPLPASYLTAVSGMESDYERRRVLDPLLSRDRLTPADRARVLEVLATMDSDYERAEVLLGVVEGGPLDQATRAPFFRAVDRMSSDHERQRVLTAVVEGRPDEATLLAVLEAVRAMDSDYSRAEVLVAVARRGLATDQLRQAYLRATDDMSSSYERDRARRAAGLRGT
jgi:beta-lactamase regulating signal transducer with metallopeptidase domain